MADFALKLESIGDAQRHKYWLWTKGKVKMSKTALRGARSLMKRRPFVKKVIGIAANGNMVRTDVRGFKDYTRVESGCGQRGVFYCYALNQGNLYEIQEQTSQKKCRRYWAIPNNGELFEVTHQQACEYARGITS